MSPVKEVSFFSDDRRFTLGREYYEEFFSEHASEPVIGEATPFYHYVPVVPERIHSLLPSVKLVFSLRDPINRAYSAFQMKVWQGGESSETSFLDAVRRNPAYLDNGRYAYQLSRYYRFFNPEQVLVVWFDDLKRNPAVFYNSICDFLSIERFDFEKTEVKHSLAGRRHKAGMVQTGLHAMRTVYDNLANSPLSPIVRSRPVYNFGRSIRKRLLKSASAKRLPPLAPEIRRRLLPVTREPNNELQKMTGRDLSSWNE